MIFTIKKFENIHILLWLLKDTAWMMDWNTFGMIMIAPTVIVAILIAIKDYRNGGLDFWIQFAVCMWIIANSYWMACEFYEMDFLKYYALIPFALGFLSVARYYFGVYQLPK